MSHGFAIYRSSIGCLLVEHRDEKLTRLQILCSESQEVGVADLFTDRVFAQVEEYLAGERQTFDVELDLSACTPFQRCVLEELRRIPFGQTRSYGQVAEAIGNSKASRAVGNANNRNPIHIIIPCHRVVGASGALTGYAAGVDVKAKLLALEVKKTNSLQQPNEPQPRTTCGMFRRS